MIRAMLVWSVGAFAGVALGCAEGVALGNGAGAGACTPGVSVACECPDGRIGAQSCNLDGLGFSPCACTDDATGSDSGSGSSGAEGDGSGDAQDTSTGGDAGSCPDGVEDPGECDPGDAAYCPADCTEPVGTGTGDPCAVAPTFFGLVAGVSSRWEHNGFVGVAAGDAMCQGLGADHACDYEEVLSAELKGELAGIAAGTTGWLHRTTVANVVGGALSNPGLGGRCVDWTYSTNHLSDGEYVEFTPGGPAYHIDDDTFYDGASTEHAQVDLLQCGNQMRAVLCCHAACM